MMCNNKKIIVFDVDGTLFDTKPGIFDALEDVFEHFGLGEFNHEIGDKYIGPSIKDSMMKFHGMNETKAQEVALYYRQVYIDHYIQNSTPYDGIRELIDKLLDEGYRLAIATNKTSRQVEKLFSVTEVEKGRFFAIKTAIENGGLTKTEMLQQIVEETGESHSVVMIGDTFGDQKAAEAARVGFVGVTYGYGFDTQETYDFLTVGKIQDMFDCICELI